MAETPLERVVALARRVQTPEGSKLFKQPIGSIIIPDKQEKGRVLSRLLDIGKPASSVNPTLQTKKPLEKIADGAARNVYADGDFVVKKEKDSNGANAREAAAYKKLKSHETAKAKLPKTELLPNGDLKQERIVGEKPDNHRYGCPETGACSSDWCAYREISRAFSQVADIHEGQIVVRAGVAYLIDMSD